MSSGRAEARVGAGERVLLMTRAHRRGIIDHCIRALPREGCGILGGKYNRVTRVFCLDNTATGNNRYLIDPVQQLHALRSLEDQGLDLVGIFHSHPIGDATPSAIDVEQAYYPNSVYVIVGLRYAKYPVVRAFRIVDGKVHRVALRIGDI